jgi:Fur family transcriptional regulator, ferric uptake regulator
MTILARHHLADVLHERGMRLTSQRALLLELIESEAGHLDAHELCKLAQERDPRINLSTVYRTVALLRDLGLIEEVHLAEDHHHYEAGGPAGHQHLICLGCGRVVEFTSLLVERLARSVGKAHGFEIAGARIDLTGYCPDCQAARAKQEAADRAALAEGTGPDAPAEQQAGYSAQEEQDGGAA